MTQQLHIGFRSPDYQITGVTLTFMAMSGSVLCISMSDCICSSLMVSGRMLSPPSCGNRHNPRGHPLRESMHFSHWGVEHDKASAGENKKVGFRRPASDRMSGSGSQMRCSILTSFRQNWPTVLVNHTFRGLLNQSEEINN